METQDWKCRKCDHIVITPWEQLWLPKFCQRCSQFDTYFPLTATPKPRIRRPGALTAGFIPDRRRIPLSALKGLARRLLPVGPDGLSQEVAENFHAVFGGE